MVYERKTIVTQKFVYRLMMNARGGRWRLAEDGLFICKRWWNKRIIVLAVVESVANMHKAVRFCYHSLKVIIVMTVSLSQRTLLIRWLAHAYVWGLNFHFPKAAETFSSNARQFKERVVVQFQELQSSHESYMRYFHITSSQSSRQFHVSIQTHAHLRRQYNVLYTRVHWRSTYHSDSATAQRATV